MSEIVYPGPLFIVISLDWILFDLCEGVITIVPDGCTIVKNCRRLVPISPKLGLGYLVVFIAHTILFNIIYSSCCAGCNWIIEAEWIDCGGAREGLN